MRTLRMTTLDCQRQRLEQEIIDSKKKILLIRESDFPDLKQITQLRETIERSMQLLSMLEQHVQASSTRIIRQS